MHDPVSRFRVFETTLSLSSALGFQLYIYIYTLGDKGQRDYTGTHVDVHSPRLRYREMRNCFIGHCLCTQLLYHSFTEGGVSLTTNQFESAPRDLALPSLPTWKHRAPLSGQCFVSPDARRPAVPRPTNFLAPPSLGFVTPGEFVAEPRDEQISRKVPLFLFDRRVLDNNIVEGYNERIVQR